MNLGQTSSSIYQQKRCVIFEGRLYFKVFLDKAKEDHSQNSTIALKFGAHSSVAILLQKLTSNNVKIKTTEAPLPMFL